MSSEEKKNDERLNESWVEVVEGQAGSVSQSPVPARAVNSAMEKLLLEAQKESSSSASHADSPASSNSSTRSFNGDRAANSESPQADADLKGTDWVWDWSSRPEAIPPSGTASHLKHPTSQRCRFSIRNTRVMSGLYLSLEHLPMLLISHACSFLLGATTMFIYMRRFSTNLNSVVSSVAWVVSYTHFRACTLLAPSRATCTVVDSCSGNCCGLKCGCSIVFLRKHQQTFISLRNYWIINVLTSFVCWALNAV